MQKQVDRSSYSKGYIHQQRWMSYFNQITALESLKPKSILEVGAATFITANYFKEIQNQVDYRIVDIDPELHPDYLGSVTELPLPDQSYDVVCAFQVLEHIPYKDVDLALSELHRVTKRHVVLSLPHYGSHIRFELKIPLTKNFQFIYKFPSRTTHVFDGEHYWEIGKKNYSLNEVVKKISKKFSLLKNYIPYHTPYHRFFILEKK